MIGIMLGMKKNGKQNGDDVHSWMCGKWMLQKRQIMALSSYEMNLGYHFHVWIMVELSSTMSRLKISLSERDILNCH